MVGRLVSRRFQFVGDDAWKRYIGVIVEAEDTDATWSEEAVDAEASYQLDFEDGALGDCCWGELKCSALAADNCTLVPQALDGSLYVATRKAATVRSLDRGLLAAMSLDSEGEPHKVVVMSATYCVAPTENDTRVGRVESRETLASRWTFERIPRSVWPGQGVADATTRVQALWDWLARPAEDREAKSQDPVEQQGSPPSSPPSAGEDEDPDTAAGVSAQDRMRRDLIEYMPEVLRHASSEPKQPKTWEELRRRVKKSRGGELGAYRPRVRFKPLKSAEEDREIARAVAPLLVGKLNTLRGTRSMCEGYLQACATRIPPVLPFPITAEKVAHWWGRKWDKEHRLNQLYKYFGAIRQVAAAKGFDLDSRPPGCSYFESVQIKVAQKAFSELDEEGVRRAFPFTLLLFRFLLPSIDLDDDFQLQCWARALLAHIAMTRSEDHTKGRPRWGHFFDLSDEAPGRATWMVEPGKAHKLRSAAQVPGYSDAHLDDCPLEIQVGYVFAKYRAMLQRRFRHIDPGAPLFPDLEAGHRSRNLGARAKPMRDDKFLGFLRERCRRADLPPQLVARISFHSFRSGGATDFFTAGCDIPGIREYIQKQGRWASACFRIYIRLRATAVASVAARVLKAAAAALPKDVDPSSRAQRCLVNLRRVVPAEAVGPGADGAVPPMPRFPPLCVLPRPRARV